MKVVTEKSLEPIGKLVITSSLASDKEVLYTWGALMDNTEPLVFVDEEEEELE